MGEAPDWASTETNMMLIIDTLAHRYHCLPSQVLAQANTFDLRVNEIRALHERRQQQAQSGSRSDSVLKQPQPQLTQDQMTRMIADAQQRQKRKTT